MGDEKKSAPKVLHLIQYVKSSVIVSEMWKAYLTDGVYISLSYMNFKMFAPRYAPPYIILGTTRSRISFIQMGLININESVRIYLPRSHLFNRI